MAVNRAGKYEIVVTYMKCLRNHATGSMALVLDGCCEFAPGGQEGTPSYFFCAACGCHRHFHQRSEKLVPSPMKNNNPSSSSDSDQNNQQQLIKDNVSPVVLLVPSSALTVNSVPASAPPPPPPPSPSPSPSPSYPNHLPQAAAAATADDQQDKGETEEGNGDAEKKGRTRITPEQKEVMRAFADRVGWTLRNREEEEIMGVCYQLGITRPILKNWINNNRKKVMAARAAAAAGGQRGTTSAQDPEVIVLRN